MSEVAEIKKVSTPNAPAAGGHYSQAVVYGGLVYVSGQLPIDPRAGAKHVGTIEEQTEQTLRNVGEVLRAAGSGLERVLKMTVYVSDIDLWPAVNAVYARVMGEHRPARAVVPVKELHYGFQIEIEAVAALNEE
ncbi:MAG TPA: Rid family detoxifying hydrolase [Pyrinomonadaceae bacterium]|nr:Rid family detoxifying hydrolase [Pyrinomonadaceae bacterium]